MKGKERKQDEKTRKKQEETEVKSRKKQSRDEKEKKKRRRQRNGIGANTHRFRSVQYWPAPYSNMMNRHSQSGRRVLRPETLVALFFCFVFFCSLFSFDCCWLDGDEWNQVRMDRQLQLNSTSWFRRIESWIDYITSTWLERHWKQPWSYGVSIIPWHSQGV